MQPTETLALFKTNLMNPRRSGINRPEVYAITQLGSSTLQQLTRLLTSSRSDTAKEKALDILSVLVNDTNALAPSGAKEKPPITTEEENQS